MKGNAYLSVGIFILLFILGIFCLPIEKIKGSALNVTSGDILVFSAEKDGDSDIYLMDIEGFETIQLTYSPSYQENPVVSPDGKYIAYCSTESGTGEIYIMNIDGSGKKRLSIGGGQHPTWHPSGEWIYYAKPIGLRPFSYKYAICKVRKDGTGLQRITYFGYRNICPRISHDGMYLYFADDPNWTPDDRIVRTNADGSNPEIILDRNGVTEGRFSISPDDSTLLLTVSENPDGYTEPKNLYFLDIETGIKTRIFNRTGRESYRNGWWSPDGAKFVYSYTPDYLYEKYDLYIYDIENKNIIRLTNTPNINENEVSWGHLGPSSLVACWHFDEGTGNIIHDSSGNNNNGVIHGASWTKGVWGYALNFDGKDDYIEIPDSPLLDLTDSFTIEGWIYTREIEKNDAQFILCKHKTFYDNRGTWNLASPEKGNYLEFSSCGQGTIKSSNISNFSWTHFAFTFNDTTNEYAIYINGEIDVKGNKSFQIMNTNINIYIGAERYENHEEMWHFFNGILDEIRIYNKALPPDEIRRHYLRYALLDANLTIANISFSNDEPIEGEIIHITPMIVNKGGKDVNVTVKFYVDSEDKQLQTISNLHIGAHESISPSIRWDTGGMHGEHKIWIELSNIQPKDYSFQDGTFRSIFIAQAPEKAELYISKEDISFSTQAPSKDEEVIIYAVIHNLGNSSAKAFVDFYNGKNLSDFIGTSQIFLNEKDSEVASMKWNAMDDGEYDIVVKIRDCNPPEKTEKNNEAYNTLQVGGNYKPSLVITSGVSNIAPFEENTERIIPIRVFCYNQKVENIHLVILQDDGLEITPITPDFTLQPGQKEDYLIDIKVPPLEKNKRMESRAILIQAVGDAGATWSNTEQIDILIHEPGLSFIFNAALMITGIGGFLAFLFVAFTETGKYKFFSLLSLLVPSLVRVKKDKILDTVAREEIFKYIEKNPGCCYSEIMRALNIKNGVLSYHLYVLEKEGFIFSNRNGLRYRIFYPAGENADTPDIVRLTKLQKSILNLIKQNPGITQKEMINTLNKSQQTISYNVNILKRMGKIRSKKEGRTHHYYINDGD